MTEPEVRTLTNEELVAVAALWKRTNREFVTSFRGVSMEPAIPDSAPVRVCCADVGVGDIAAYVDGGRVIVHRVIAVWKDHLVTRGDANLLPDAVLLEPGDTIGKVLAVRSQGEWAPPRRVTPSLSASLLLWLSSIIARVFGIDTARRFLGVLRMLHQRVRSALH